MANTVDDVPMGRTTIQVSDELADELYRRKKRGESYEDVIWRILDDEKEERERKPETRESVVAEPVSTETTTELDIPQTVNPDDAADAIAAAKNVLEEEGSATKREIVASVMPKYPLGYDVDSALEKVDEGGRYRGAWWRRVIKAGLEADDDVEKPTGGRSDWRYTGKKSDE